MPDGAGVDGGRSSPRGSVDGAVGVVNDRLVSLASKDFEIQ